MMYSLHKNIFHLIRICFIDRKDIVRTYMKNSTSFVFNWRLFLPVFIFQNLSCNISLIPSFFVYVLFPFSLLGFLHDTFYLIYLPLYLIFSFNYVIMDSFLVKDEITDSDLYYIHYFLFTLSGDIVRIKFYFVLYKALYVCNKPSITWHIPLIPLNHTCD